MSTASPSGTTQAEDGRRASSGPPAGQASDDAGYRSAKESWALLRELLGVQPPSFKAIIDEFGFLPPHVFALRRLATAGPTPMGELGGRLHCDKSTMTWVADQLEQRGLIERRGAPRDRRVKLLAITEVGAKVHRDLEARLSEPPPELAALPPEDQGALHDILRRALDARAADRGD